ncbi:DUF4148 domain-containing protein [Rhodoferax ferrireducens]|uniref:DUF4148 domain-containing protein n=1 Tax=Rhodoferax ferrireducens TaxID=192843 RepID=UPI000E0D8CE7|nr:DUF4148 domain-containing protein [Rhodoferax ferrireducens]
MKTSKILASTLIALSCVAAGSAFAADRDDPVVAVAPSTSTLTRAEVHAELIQARKEGSLTINDHDYPVIHATGTPKTREEVRAETAAAMKDRTLDLRGDFRS